MERVECIARHIPAPSVEVSKSANACARQLVPLATVNDRSEIKAHLPSLIAVIGDLEAFLKSVYSVDLSITLINVSRESAGQKPIRLVIIHTSSSTVYIECKEEQLGYHCSE